MLASVVRVIEVVIIGYFLLYNTINLFLLVVAWVQVRFFLRLKAIGSLESLYRSSSTPAVTIVAIRPPRSESRRSKHSAISSQRFWSRQRMYLYLSCLIASISSSLCIARVSLAERPVWSARSSRALSLARAGP